METLRDDTELKCADEVIALFLPGGQLALYHCSGRRMLQVSTMTLTILQGFGDWRSYGEVRDAVARRFGSDAVENFAPCVETLCEASMLLRRGVRSDVAVNVFEWSGFATGEEPDNDISDRWFSFKFERDGRLGKNAYRFVEWAALKRLIEQTGGLADLRLLDLGCGSGFYAVACAKEGAIVSGVDSNGRLLARARALADQEGVAVALRQADLRRPDSLDGYAAESFDRVICIDTLVNLLHESDLDTTEVRNLLGRVRRLVSADGRLFVMDPHPVFAFLPRFGPERRPFTILTEYAQKRDRYSRIMPPLQHYLHMFLDTGWTIERLEELTPEPDYEGVNTSSYFFYRQFPGWLALVLKKG